MLKIKVPKITLVLIVSALWILSIVAALQFFGKGLPQVTLPLEKSQEWVKVVDEESVVIDVVEKVSPLVV